MRVVEAFQIKGNIHDSITAIRVDRNLTGEERARKTAEIGGKQFSVGSTSIENMIWTADTVQNPNVLVGEEIILI